MISIYTDGSCDKAGNGSWAFVGVHSAASEIVFQNFGVVNNATNNRMELTAAIKAIQYMSASKMQFPIKIFSDSAYVIGGFTKGWEKTWRKNNWIGSQGREIKNRDLWEIILNLEKQYSSRIEWLHIRGHNGDKWNEYCDRLSRNCRNKELQFEGGRL